MLTLQEFVFNPFQENTYVVYDQTGEGIIIDPGCSSTAECVELDSFIAEKKISVKYLLNTHCHIDHVLGNSHVKEKYKVPFLVHRIEEAVLRSVKTYAPNYGFSSYHEVLPDQFVEENDEIKFGNETLKVIFLPGHSPGHVGFFSQTEKVLICGDVLFESSIGRTDLPGGNFKTLIQSIHQKLFTLPDDTVVYPGHGGTTTIGIEKKNNPYCSLDTHS